ncbi:MAG: hypothetical protein Kow0031_11690 [Anaerolineae bacterium]
MNVQTQLRKQKRFFWMALVIFFALSGGYISATSVAANSNTLVINEVMAANGSGLVDEDGDFSDWIEIYNPSNAPANLSGWALTNDPNQPQQWDFPDITLGGGEYLVVFASGKDRASTGTGQLLHTNFKLSKNGEFLALYNVLEDRFVDVVGEPFPRQFEDVSFGRTGDTATFAYMPSPTPGQPNNSSQVWLGTVEPVSFSVEHGYFNAPVAVSLSSATAEAVIRYTTDGSEPTLTNGQEYIEPLQLNESTILRAAAFKPNMLPSQIGTRSYLFNDNILGQLSQPLVLPGSEALGARQVITEHAHPINDERYGAELLASLQAIPAISLVMPPQPLQSLYLRGFDQDREAERPVSVELLTPASALNSGFQTNAGIRPYGDADHAKRSFKLYFRGEYGPANLIYPLFDDSPVTMFDTVILQAVTPGQSADEIVRAAWLQKTQQEMTGLAAHQEFVHLYLNGTYWGLYRLTEQTNADFMANYVGGDSDHWYLADSNGPRREMDDVQTQALNDLFNMLALVSRVDESLVQPALLEEPFNTLSAWFDPVQFSDFVLLHGYTTNQAWPQNDWLATVRLTDLPGRGRFLLNGEQTPLSPAEMGGVSRAETHSPALRTLFSMWMENPDFRVTFADRAHRNLTGDGPLSDAGAQTRWDELSATIDQAIAVELARWDSDAYNDAADSARVQFEGTANRLIARARAEGFYPELDPPVFSRGDSLVSAGESLSIFLPDAYCGGCRIYYTTDGSDPRLLITGDVIPTAQEYTRPIELSDNTRVKARVWQPPLPGSDQPRWSALRQADFNVVAQDNPLRITEVMYNPPNGDDFEYIELFNSGSAPVELARLIFDDGIRYRFPPNTPPLGAGEYAVLVSNPTAFALQYPSVKVWGAYEGHLSNKGEHFELLTPDGQTLLEVRYDDENGWPVSADGRGDSLTLVDINANPGNPKSWRASAEVYGSPGSS